MIEMYCDGASRGNPGKASIGVSILKNGKEVYTISRALGLSTNNVAEWNALLAGLQECIRMGEREVCVFLDSELVVKQYSGEYKTKHKDLIPLKEKVRALVPSFENIQIRHIRRENNKRADELANMALDRIES